DEAPRYRVEVRERAPVESAPAAQGPPTIQATLLDLLRSPNVRSRAWIYERYDHLVGSRTVRRPGLDAAVLRLRPSLRGLAVSLDGSGRVGRLDPWAGGAAAVLEAARNVACAGGEPLAFTDCLNFGNPEKPEIAWELERAGDPPDAGRRLHRPRPRRTGGARPLARGRRRAAGRRAAADARRLRVPGALRAPRGPRCGARPGGGGPARRVPLARRADPV